MPLTKRQKQVLDFLRDFREEHGYSPSYEEIAQHFSLSSLATVHEHIENLREKGYLRKAYKSRRSIELMPARLRVSAMELPLFGTVAAGQPIEAIEEQETISVPEEMLSRGGHNYVLRVRGESMIDEQIRDGDFIIVNSRRTARNGEMVVALIEDESATVKKFYLESDGQVRLQPANPSMAPMYFPATDVKIQGIVVGVIRRY